MRLNLGYSYAYYRLSFRTWLKFPIRRKEEANNGISFSGRETPNCIRWLHQIKNFSVFFLPASIDKLLNWSFVFYFRKKIEEAEKSIHKYCHKTLPMYSIQKSGNFIFLFWRNSLWFSCLSCHESFSHFQQLKWVRERKREKERR